MGLADNQTANEYSQYVFKSCLKNDTVMLRYLQENDNVTAEKLESFHNFFNVLKNKRALIEIGKCVIKSVMCNTKKAVLNVTARDESRSKLVNRIFAIVHPVFTFIEPENIETKLTEDEYLALISDMVKKDKKHKSVNLYVVIGTNMLMSLVSNNLAGLISSASNKDGTFLNTFSAANISKPPEISDEAIDNLYKKVITTTNDDIVEADSEDSTASSSIEMLDRNVVAGAAADMDGDIYRSPSPSPCPSAPPPILNLKRKRESTTKMFKDSKRAKRKLVFDDEPKTKYYDEDDDDEEDVSVIDEDDDADEEEKQLAADIAAVVAENLPDAPPDIGTFDISSIFQEIGEKDALSSSKTSDDDDDDDDDVDQFEDVAAAAAEGGDDGGGKKAAVAAQEEEDDEEEEELLELGDVAAVNGEALITKQESMELNNKKTASISKMLELFKTKNDSKYKNESKGAHFE